MVFGCFNVFILFDTQLTGYQTSFIAARKVIDTEMRAIESNIFWCFVERLAQINNRAVLVSATNKIINQWFLVFFTNKVIKYYYLLGIFILQFLPLELYHHCYKQGHYTRHYLIYQSMFVAYPCIFVAPNFWHTNVFYHNTKVVSSAYGTINLSFQILNYHILTSETCHLHVTIQSFEISVFIMSIIIWDFHVYQYII